MEIIEKTGPTVEAAVKAGVEELGVTPDQVMVEVIEEPNRGLLGIGAKPARVRIIFMGQRPSAQEETAPEPKKDSKKVVAYPMAWAHLGGHFGIIFR